MKDAPYWLDMPYDARPALAGDIETDVLVVGGGIAGVSAAYHCAKAGFKTVLIEKETIASGSAGKNGGMIVEGLELDFWECIEKFGAKEAKQLWLDSVESRKHIANLVSEHNIDCDFFQPGSLYVGITDAEKEIIEKEYSARQKADIDCQLLYKSSDLTPDSFEISLLNPHDCFLHPAKFVRGLAKVAEDLGATIYEYTPGLKIEKNFVETPNGKIKAQKVILALESSGFHPDNGSTLYRSEAIVTEPLTNEKIDTLNWKAGKMLWSTGEDYISIRKIGNRLFSCETLPTEPTPQETKKNIEWQIDKLHSFFPTLNKEDLVVSHSWSGLIVDNKNRHPYIRQLNGCYEISGHGGYGFTNGVMCGLVVSNHFLGKEIPVVYQ